MSNSLGCLGILLIPTFGFAIAAIAIALTTRRRIQELESAVASGAHRIDALELRSARGEPARPAEAPAPVQETAAREAAAAAPEPVPQEAPVAQPPQPVQVAPPRSPVFVEPAVAPAPETQVAPPVEAAPPAPVFVPAAAYDATAASEPAMPDIPLEPPPPSRPAPPPKAPFDWENLIGVKLFSWIAGVALLLAALFFLKYSVDHGWLMPPVRMAIGIATGIALLVVSQFKAANRYRVTANALDASGIAILYASFFASHALWHLLPSTMVFGAMILVTIVAVRLSIVRDSIFISLLGLFGGFLTPWLLSTGQDKPIALFTYLLLLNAGLAWVAYKKRWPVLTGLTLLFTTIYQWGWVAKFLTPEKLPIAVGIFISFPILGIIALMAGARGRDESWRRIFERFGAIGATLPLAFAVYFAAVPAFGNRYHLLFGFLFCLAAGCAAVAAARPAMRAIHAAGAAATLVSLLAWSWGDSYTPQAWPACLAWITAFVALYLAAPMLAWRFAKPYEGIADRAVLVAPLLLFIFPLFPLFEPKAASPTILFGTLLLLLLGTAAWAIRHERGSVYFIASFFAVATEATWSARFLDATRLLPALLVYMVFALVFIGVPIVARRLNRSLHPARAAAFVLLASVALLFFLAGGPVAPAALWGIAILLAVLNLGAMQIATAGRGMLLAVAGAVLSWIVLAVWWFTAPVALQVVPALAVVGGFAVVLIAGNTWLQRNPATRIAAETSGGIYSGLIGHLFLAFVASQEALAIPPWPLFAILFLIDLAIAAAAFIGRRSRLQIAAMAASQIVLMIWAGIARVSPWPETSFVTAALVGVFALAWMALVRNRVAAQREPALYEGFTAAAVAALFLGHFVVIVASGATSPPSIHTIWATHLFFAAALLFVAAISRWHAIAPFAVIPGALAVEAWRTAAARPWHEEILLATVLYLPFIAYPLIVGAKSKASRAPWIGAIAASVAYFFFARHAIELGGYGYAIGLLPVAEAALLLLLVRQLLRIQSGEERDRGRLSLVAAAALAFVTVAIPLQLEKEWITIGWALEGAALAWLYTRIRHRGLFYACGALMAVVFVRLVFNPAVLEYHTRGALVIFNWYLYTYLVAAAAFYLAGWILRGSDDGFLSTKFRLSPLLAAAGTVLLFLLLNIEIADFYSTGKALTFNFSAGLAQDLTYTLGWALFAICMLIVGIYASNRPTRIASLVLLVLTILKCFLHDLWRVGGLYRVGSFVGLAVSLTLVALLLQRFVLKAPAVQKEQTP